MDEIGRYNRRLINAIQTGKYGFMRANFPNGDMVGHTGDFRAARIAVEAVDLCLGRIVRAARDAGAVLIVTADHGNADEMYEKKKGDEEPRAKTAHTLNPVPFIIYDSAGKHVIKQGSYGLANVAPTIVRLLGIEPPGVWESSMV